MVDTEETESDEIDTNEMYINCKKNDNTLLRVFHMLQKKKKQTKKVKEKNEEDWKMW